MLTILCDRCKRGINQNKDRYYLKITRQGNFKDGGNEVDLCDCCYKEFIKWIGKGKENEE